MTDITIFWAKNTIPYTIQGTGLTTGKNRGTHMVFGLPHLAKRTCSKEFN